MCFLVGFEAKVEHFRALHGLEHGWEVSLKALAEDQRRIQSEQENEEHRKTSVTTLVRSVPRSTGQEVKRIARQSPTDPDGGRYRGTPVSVGRADL